MKKGLIFSTIALGILMIACDGKNSSEYKALKAERDSLALQNAKSVEELDQIVTLMNEVQDNFNSIKAAENYLSVQSNTGGELSVSARDRIRSDMAFVSETLEKNKQQIADLEKRLKASGLKSSKLAETVKSLQTQLDERVAELIALKEELSKKDHAIAELSNSIASLSGDVQTLKTEAGKQQEMLRQQDAEIHTVYYCFGTSKELKAMKAMENGQLGTAFNKDDFIKVKDYRDLSLIPLQAKKAKLISRHPAGSYEFLKNEKNQVDLKINDPQKFWSVSKYLVVEVNV